MFSPSDFIDLLQGANQNSSPFRLGVIDPAYSAGRPKVQFDGESSVSAKVYPYLGAYTPHASDRVLLAVVGSSYVVLGKVT